MVSVLIFSAFPINAGSDDVTPMGSGSEPTSSPDEFRIWEAYAKGDLTISSSSDRLSFIITNTGSENITIDEYVLLMSPNPYQSPLENPTGTKWTQDGSLTFNYVPPGGSRSYNYGDYVVGVYSPPRPPPPWWCTEDSEGTTSNVAIELTGEIMPFALWDVLANPNGDIKYFYRGDIGHWASVTQVDIWYYLRNNSAPVVGKLPMWKEVPNIPTEVEIDLAVTNIGFQQATSVVLVDTLPPDYQLKSGSATPNPSSIIPNLDGSTTLKWNLGSMRGAIQTDDSSPTDYAHEYITYTLITPSLDPDERYLLPRAQVDNENDGVMDAHSEEPLLETYLVNSPPVASINTAPINEGETTFVDGSASYDPDEVTGDHIVSYEWDLGLDGTVDATGEWAFFEFGDDGVFPVSLTVTDTYGVTGKSYANITVYNVAPSVTVDIDHQVTEVSIRMAGSKWSNVELTIFEDDSSIGFIEVERWPGSPDDNPTYGSPTIPIVFESGRTYKAIVTYDPYPDSGDKIRGDQPNNGKDKKDNAGNPVWIILTSENGTQTKIHHTFNTQQSKIRDSDHWNHVEPWEVELNEYLEGSELKLTAMAYDPGADDLTFTWDFDDGTLEQNHFPNPGGVFPFSATDVVDYSGSATKVTLTCEDDDGGVWVDTYFL
jgi:uncharacterized repeat protein (TIGR01451 family)